MTGLENTNDDAAKKLALVLVQKWVKNNYVAYVQSKGKMFEKYDVEQVKGHLSMNPKKPDTLPPRTWGYFFKSCAKIKSQLLPNVPKCTQ